MGFGRSARFSMTTRVAAADALGSGPGGRRRFLLTVRLPANQAHLASAIIGAAEWAVRHGVEQAPTAA
jgi:hypothetical protein